MVSVKIHFHCMEKDAMKVRLSVLYKQETEKLFQCRIYIYYPYKCFIVHKRFCIKEANKVT